MSELDGVPNLEVVGNAGHPALIVQNGDFGEPPPEWAVLGERRDALKAILPSVGRIEGSTGSFTIRGTGFMVADGVLMTNAHVAAKFTGNTNVTKPTRVDFTAELGVPGTNRVEITDVIAVHGKYDLALLRLAASGPPPLQLSPVQPRVIRDGNVAAIGYPTRESPPANLTPFNNIFNVKRLQPGKSTGMRSQPQKPLHLGHNCSTLGGNSGSCIVDLETGLVIGLHTGGLTQNFAVPFWLISAENIVKNLNWAVATPTPVPKQRPSRPR